MLFKLSKRPVIIQGTRNAVLLNEFFNIFWFPSFNRILEIPEIQLYKGTKFQFPAAEAKPFPQAKFNHKRSKHSALPVDICKKINTLVR